MMCEEPQEVLSTANSDLDALRSNLETLANRVAVLESQWNTLQAPPTTADDLESPDAVETDADDESAEVSDTSASESDSANNASSTSDTTASSSDVAASQSSDAAAS
jgi:hypothetical protein